MTGRRGYLSSVALKALTEELSTASRGLGLSGPLSSDMTAVEASRVLFSRGFFKKLKDSVAPTAAQMAVEKFLEFNQRCKVFELKPTALFDDELVNGVRDLLDSWLHPFGVPLTLEDFLTEARPGKKASIGCEEIDFYTKLFDSPLTCTNDTLRVLYRTYVSRNPTWLAAEKARSSYHGDRNVRGSKLSTVPKQLDIARTIATEPTLNMFFQLGIGLEIRRVMLSRLGLDLRDQQNINAKLAKIGSADGTFGTIDLASASDSISTSLCESILPAYFVRWLKLTRSPVTVLPTGQVVELSMISSMGNGFTFPLQTMIFAAIVKVAYQLLGFKARFRSAGPEKPVTCGVFGDDIIVRREAYDYIVSKLPLFGFVVNVDKSFNTGDFRESCGKDYWRGVPVRSIYVKTLEHECDCYSAINRIVRWGWLHGHDVKPLIRPLMRRVRLLPIPPRDADHEGIHVPGIYGISFCDLETRFPVYRILEYSTHSWRPNITKGRRRLRRKNVPLNWDGLTVAFVGGFLRDGRFSVRSEIKRSKVRQRQVPFWDYAPMASGVNHLGVSWQAYALEVFAEYFEQGS